jgi:hypothetical protein
MDFLLGYLETTSITAQKYNKMERKGKKYINKQLRILLSYRTLNQEIN